MILWTEPLSSGLGTTTVSREASLAMQEAFLAACPETTRRKDTDMQSTQEIASHIHADPRPIGRGLARHPRFLVARLAEATASRCISERTGAPTNPAIDRPHL